MNNLAHNYQLAPVWKRMAAAFIDNILLGFVPLFMLLPETMPVINYIDTPINDIIRQLIWGLINPVLVLFVVHWLYFTLLHISPWQASFGKKLWNINVANLQGKRITFLQANIRYLSKLLIYISIGISFFILFFTKKKQTLHDIFAKTMVIQAI